MRTAALHTSRDLRIEERVVPEVGGDDVLVRVRACGICPTDLRKYTGKSGARLPLVLGHESAGDVISVGPDVESVDEGARVCLMPWWPCGRCATCGLGRFIQCPNLTSIGGATEKSVMVNGAFTLWGGETIVCSRSLADRRNPERHNHRPIPRSRNTR